MDHPNPHGDGTWESFNTWGPLHHSVFRWLWTASVLSNIGTWMQSTATAWLMTSLAPSAFMVALVQTATTLPVFLLALPAGVLADMLDRRKLILFTQVWMLLAAAVLGVLTQLGRIDPWMLLLLTLCISLGSALNAPAWQAIIPELVSPPEIPAAVALNSAGFNVARTVGPALGGIVVGYLGAGAAFMANAVSYLAVVGVLVGWKRQKARSSSVHASFMGAMLDGIRFVFCTPALRAVLLSSGAFILSGSALLALLPYLARYQLSLTAWQYGILLGAFGCGAVVGAALLSSLRKRLFLEGLILLGSLVFGEMMVGIALIEEFHILCALLVVSGVAWLVLLSTCLSSVQGMLPSWIRGRVMALYMLVFFGGMAVGGLVWGGVASWVGIPRALLLAAASVIGGVLFTTRLKLSTLEFSPLSATPEGSPPSFRRRSDSKK